MEGSRASPIANQRLLHFQLLEMLGEGGMGVVYKARDTRLDRLVAIKVLPPDKVASAERKARFVQEAKAASALNHPNIVVVHDIASDNGTDFIVMEYVPGKTLDQLIPASGMRLDAALKIAIQVADAVARAHAHGIVHRDLKPSNIIVDEHGRAKVVDFGLAKLSDQSTSQENSTATVAVKTDPGKVVGTAPYMSPEQVEAKPVDARSDIFSFGSILYEMLSGRRAFSGESAMATLSAILTSDPKPIEGLPSDLQKLIARCQRKDPARRYQHMDDVRIALEDLKEDSDSGRLSEPALISRRGASKSLIAAGSAAAIILLAAGTWFLWRGNRTAEDPSAPEPLTSYPGYEFQPSFSPDGNQVAFVWDGEHQDNADIYIKLIGSEKPLRLTSDPADDISPAWSPDGRFVAFVRYRSTAGNTADVYTVPAIGGPERLVAQSGKLGGSSPEPEYIKSVPHPLVAWTQDGKSLLFVRRPTANEPFGISIVSLETGDQRQITSPPRGVLGDGAVVISGGGRAVLFSRAENMGSADLYRLPITPDFRPAGEPEQLTSQKGWSATPVWMPGDRELLFSLGGMSDGPYRLWRMQVGNRGAARELAALEDAGWPAYSPARKRLVFSRTTTDSNIWRVPLNGRAKAGVPEKFIGSTRDENVPQYSPDGSKIVFTSSRSGQHEVWISASDGSNLAQLTSLHAAVTGSPHWSPDGTQIVFDSTADRRYQIYTISVAGGPPRRLTSNNSDNAVASYSRDGRYIYFTSNRSGRWEIWRMPAQGGEPLRITQGGGRGPVQTPDGKFIYYERGRPRRLWRCAADGGSEAQVAPSVGNINFTLTQDGVYLIAEPDQGKGRAVQFLPYSSSDPETVLTILNPVTTGLTVSPDGRYLLYSQIDQKGSDLMLVENFR